MIHSYMTEKRWGLLLTRTLGHSVVRRQFDYPVLNGGGHTLYIARISTRDAQYRTDQRLIHRSVRGRRGSRLRPRPSVPRFLHVCMYHIMNSGDCPLPELHLDCMLFCCCIWKSTRKNRNMMLASAYITLQHARMSHRTERVPSARTSPA